MKRLPMTGKAKTFFEGLGFDSALCLFCLPSVFFAGVDGDAVAAVAAVAACARLNGNKFLEGIEDGLCTRPIPMLYGKRTDYIHSLILPPPQAELAVCAIMK